jgi:hypothetical protein
VNCSNVSVGYYTTIDPEVFACPTSCCAVVSFNGAFSEQEIRIFQNYCSRPSRKNSQQSDRIIDAAVKEKRLFYSHAFLEPLRIVTGGSALLKRTLDLLVAKTQYEAKVCCSKVYCGIESHPVSMVYQYIKPSRTKGRRDALVLAHTIAKLKRSWMIENHWSLSYPQYGWVQNQGILDFEHCRGILEYGITPLHFPTVVKEVPRWWVKGLIERDLDVLKYPSLIILRDGKSRESWVVRQWSTKFDHSFEEYLTQEERKALYRLCVKSKEPTFRKFIGLLPKFKKDYPAELESLRDPPTLSLGYPKDTLHKNVVHSMPETYEKRFLRMYEEQSQSLSPLDKLLTIDRILTLDMQQTLRVIPRTDQTWFFYLSKVLLREYKDRVPGLVTALKVRQLSRPLGLHHAFRRKTSTLLNSCYDQTAAQTLEYIDLKKEVWKVISECRSTAELTKH